MRKPTPSWRIPAQTQRLDAQGWKTFDSNLDVNKCITNKQTNKQRKKERKKQTNKQTTIHRQT